MENATAFQITIEKKHQSRHSCPQRIWVRHMLYISYLGIKFYYGTTIPFGKAVKII